jgi:hypothetical protein
MDIDAVGDRVCPDKEVDLSVFIRDDGVDVESVFHF